MLKRNCPTCDKEITYKGKQGYQRACNLRGECKSCASVTRMKVTGAKEHRSQLMSGSGNPFYGRKHTEETKQKIKDKTDNNGSNNPMYGRTVYGIWLEKYGLEEADKRLIEFKNKQSENSSGENNPMYGKPSPQGSGNGWKGWYKGVFFRSLMELSFLVNYVDRFNLKMINAEKKKYAIQYQLDSVNRNYFADYIINDKYLVEIKPLKLHNSYTVQQKQNAAIQYCSQNNLKYKLLAPTKLNKETIIQLINDGVLKFTEKYHQKVINYNEK